VDRHLNLTGIPASAEPPSGAAATWFRPQIDAGLLSSLCERRNLPALISTLLWLVGMVATGILVVISWGSLWLIPAMIAHGIMACGAADARWHECGHGTAFTRDWLNDSVYWLASFLLLREPTVWRWSHARHHSETIHVGRDPEIAFPRPPQLGVIALNFLHLHTGPRAVARLLRHSLGRIDADVGSYVPEADYRRVKIEARLFLAGLGAILAICVLTRSALPAFVIGLPAFYGAWVVMFFGATQHAGLGFNGLDHRLSTRSVRMNPVFRFLYLNMNHHLEHHLFPTVPYHRLPELQRAISSELPAPISSTWTAYRQILPTLWKQRTNPDYELQPVLPQPKRSPSEASNHSIDNGERSIDQSISVDQSISLDQLERSSVAVGGMCLVRTAEGDRLVCRVSEDDWVMTHPSCTHGDAALVNGHLTGWILECPRHNGRFDLHDGQAIRRPATIDLPVTRIHPAS
jgi:Na+-transporting NADH:ubiquinone oxidoreductase subunit F